MGVLQPATQGTRSTMNHPLPARFLRRRFCVVAVFAALVLSPSQAVEAKDEVKHTPLDARTRDFEQIHLDIAVRPHLEKGTIEGEVKVTFSSLVPSLEVLRLHAKDMKIESAVDKEGRALKATLAHGELHLALVQPLPRNEKSQVTIRYRATPTRGLFFHKPSERHPDRPLFLYSQGQGSENRRWIPCYDNPDARCSWNLSVRIPKTLTSVSNGVAKPSEEHDDDTRTDYWHYARRAPSYLISLIVGEFETVKSQWKHVSLEFNGPKGRKEELTTSLANTAAMMEFFSSYLDYPYPWPRYAQTYVWDFVYGGMENVTATTLNMRALHYKRAQPNYRSDGLVAHELAHMWFGDLLTCRTWQHMWLNEGFATYFTDLFYEHNYGTEEFLMRRRRQNRGYMDKNKTPHTLGLKKSPRGDIPLELSGGKAYSRGAAILHTLRRELGDTVFQTALRSYVKRFEDKPVRTEDLRFAAEAAAGRDLRWFFDQWVYGAGYPQLDVRYDPRAEQLIVRQLQPAKGGQSLFRIRVPVRWGPKGDTQELLIHHVHHAFPMKREGAFLRFGVGGDLLMRVKLTQTPVAWSKALLEDPDFTARMDAAEALEHFGSSGLTALTTAVRQDASWAVRRLCAEILGRLFSATSAAIISPALVSATTDSDPRVREAVMLALGKSTRGAAGVTLMQALDDPHPYVRAAAARSAGRLKCNGCFDALIKLLGVDSHNEVVRTGSLEGLRHFGDPRGFDQAVPYLDYRWGRGTNHKVREEALRCLGALGPDRRELPDLVRPLLSDPYHRMRQWAADTAGKYELKSLTAELRKIAAEDWNGGVQGAAKKALKAFGTPFKPKKPKAKGKSAATDKRKDTAR